MGNCGAFYFTRRAFYLTNLIVYDLVVGTIHWAYEFLVVT